MRSSELEKTRRSPGGPPVGASIPQLPQDQTGTEDLSANAISDRVPAPPPMATHNEADKTLKALRA